MKFRKSNSIMYTNTSGQGQLYTGLNNIITMSIWQNMKLELQTVTENLGILFSHNKMKTFHLQVEWAYKTHC